MHAASGVLALMQLGSLGEERSQYSLAALHVMLPHANVDPQVSPPLELDDDDDEDDEEDEVPDGGGGGGVAPVDEELGAVEPGGVDPDDEDDDELSLEEQPATTTRESARTVKQGKERMGRAGAQTMPHAPTRPSA